MNALSVLEYLRRKQAVSDSDEWTLFELVNDFGLERPLRDWEIVTNVINTWETAKSANAIVCKTYAYRHTLTVEVRGFRYSNVGSCCYTVCGEGKCIEKKFKS
jgi:hypothetical protein